jgi:hypothetical protein
MIESLRPESRDDIESEHHRSWRHPSRALRFLEKPLLAAVTVTVFDYVALLVTGRSVPGDILSLMLFLEGGLGLILGVGISLSSTPSVSKAGETLFGTAPWSRDAEKHAEKVGWKWMLGSTFLIIIGFMASAL